MWYTVEDRFMWMVIHNILMPPFIGGLLFFYFAGKELVVLLFLYIFGGIIGAIAVLLLFLTICMLFVSPDRYYEKDSRFYRFLIDLAAAVACLGGRLRLHITGADLLPKNKRILYVGNHVSNYDPIVTWHAFPFAKLSYISKASNFKIPWFGRFIRRCCFMDIDRENPRNAIVTINRAADLLKNQEVSVGVYPEGTRSKSTELLPFHNGVFKIAQKANSDIAVISLTGTENIHKNFPWRRTDVYVDVLEIIPADEIKGVKTDVIGSRVEALLRENKRKRTNA
jgi:1-acyl-sn-glycerol-3-phosphate acyltransferase